MIVAGFAIAMALFAVLLHGLVARWLPRRIRVMALGGATLVSFAIFVVGAAAMGASITGSQWLLAVFLTLCFMADYAIVFTGIESDSPTLAFVNEILDQGTAGLPVASLENFVRRRPFVRSRVDALVESGVLADENGVYVARGRVGLLLDLAELYRRLCGYEEEAG